MADVSAISFNPGAYDWSSPQSSGSEVQLTPEEQREVSELRETDAKVRRHEQAHLAAAGQYARGRAAFQYETGPDGKRYAVGGEVKIDVSPVPDDPQATVEKAETVQRAALAPQDPSPQDRRIAAQASRMEMEARQELARQDEEGVGYDQAARPLPASQSASFLDHLV